MSDEKHEEFRRLGSVLTEKNPKVFLPLLFSSYAAPSNRSFRSCQLALFSPTGFA